MGERVTVHVGERDVRPVRLAVPVCEPADALGRNPHQHREVLERRRPGIAADRHLALIERLRHRAERTHHRGTRRGELTELAHKRPLSLRIMKSREVISFTNVSIAELATMRQAP